MIIYLFALSFIIHNLKSVDKYNASAMWLLLFFFL